MKRMILHNSSMVCKKEIEERAIRLAEYIIDSKDTGRGAAKKFSISKSTVHKDVTERLEKINNDFATLFREGQRLLQEGCGDVMNRHREEAFQRFKALGGIPYKTEDYLYADTLPVFDRDYKVVLKYIKQEVEVGEVFKCHVPNLDTNLILTNNGWFVK